MNKILIGSTALSMHFPEANIQPKDRDYAVPVGSKSTREVEYLYNPILFKEKYQNHISTTPYLGIFIASPDMLYTLKMSHMFWDISYSKNMYYIQLMKDLGCKVIRELFYDLYTFWSEYHGKNKRSELQMSAEEFFDNSLDFPYSHDELHTLIQNPPTYTKILIGEVEVSEEKFNELSFEDKKNLVFEEVEIMSFERGRTMNYRRAYELMLKKFIQGHAPLWEAIFILDNYKEFYKPRQNHFKILEEGLKELEICK